MSVIYPIGTRLTVIEGEWKRNVLRQPHYYDDVCRDLIKLPFVTVAGYRDFEEKPFSIKLEEVEGHWGVGDIFEELVVPVFDEDLFIL